MSDNIDPSFIYTTVQHDDDGNPLFILPIKIGYSDKQNYDRQKKFKKEQFCVNPKILRLLKIKKNIQYLIYYITIWQNKYLT